MAISAQLTFDQLNSQWLQLNGLADGLSPSTYKNTATVVATMYDSTGAIVPEINAITFSYVNGSNGNYQYLVASTFDPPAGPPYTLKIDITDPGGGKAHLELLCAVAVRTS